MKTILDNKIFIVIDVGCHECGVGSEVVGVFRTKSAATRKRNQRSNETGDWRDGGQSIPEVFEVKLPTKALEEDKPLGDGK